MLLHEVLYKGYTYAYSIACTNLKTQRLAATYSTQMLQGDLLMVQQICCHMRAHTLVTVVANNETIMVVAITSSYLGNK